jgi:hypothetical protein
MKTYGGVGGIASPFLTSALDGGEWSVSRPGFFISGGHYPGTHFLGGWVGPCAELEAVKNRNISCPRQQSNPGRSARSPSLYRLLSLSVVVKRKFLTPVEN